MAWGAAGGDFVAAISGSAGVEGNGPYTMASTPMMVADVQSWIDNPSANFGWVMISDQEADQNASIRRVATREDMTLAPALQLDYIVVPEASSLLFFGLGFAAWAGCRALRRR
jgi:hypothetical protein